MSCNYKSTFELSRGYAYSLFEKIIETCHMTYIRPDPGGSMMPWLFSLLLLFLHVPSVIIRAVQWESAQYLAMGLAVLGIALTVQAFVSTGLAAAEILVWMPLTLVLDVGAMLQMVVLIIEKYDKPWREWKKNPEGEQPPRGLRLLWNAVKRFLQEVKAVLSRKVLPRRGGGGAGVRDAVELGLMGNRRNARAEQRDAAARQHRETLHYAFVAIVSAILFLMLVILQSYGLYAAAVGRNVEDIRVNWCSPAFRDFAVAVTTGNCDKYEVIDSSSNGIGCISLPGDQQRDWLLGTIISLSAAMICQSLDAVFMLYSHSHFRPRGVRAQRPWLTMIGGCLMLVVMIVFGIIHANSLPKGVTEAVWIYRIEESRKSGRVCRGSLNPPGLRGVVIGYMDGLFQSWGRVYYGH